MGVAWIEKACYWSLIICDIKTIQGKFLGKGNTSQIYKKYCDRVEGKKEKKEKEIGFYCFVGFSVGAVVTFCTYYICRPCVVIRV